MFSPPDITEQEIAEVVDTLRSGWITTGPKTKKFEKEIAEYCHTSRAVCLNSATACLESILRFLGIGEGDEVITSAYTYTASASPVCHVGANLILVDIASDNFEMDYEQLETVITEKTKAIIPVDLAGKICDYEKIYDIVERKKGLFHPNNEIQDKLGRVAVISDAAHAFGAIWKGKVCGEIADFTSFSFHAVKNLTTAEGGALTWRAIEGMDDEQIYKEFMLLSLHGQTKDALSKSQLGSWEYDIVEPAYKCNMTDIMASLGLVQLARYGSLLARRKEVIQMYTSGLQACRVEVLRHYGEDFVSSGHLYIMRVLDADERTRNDIIVELAKRGIATNVHYKPLPLLTAYRKRGFQIEDYPNAYAHYCNEITLPLHTLLSDEDVNYVIENVADVVGRR